MARVHESTEASAKGMSLHCAPVHSISGSHGVSGRGKSHNRPQSNSSSGTSDKKCSSCGYTGHSAGTSTCPGRGKTCLNCQKVGHFKRVCHSTGKNLPKSGKSASQSAHQVTEYTPPAGTGSSHSDHFSIAQVTNSTTDALFVTVNVNNVPLRMEVDTGAKVSLVPESVW